MRWGKATDTMDSLRLKNFNKWWNDRMIMMEDQHDEEIASCDSEAKEKKQGARDSAQGQIDNLRNSTLGPIDVYDQIRKIKEQRDADLRSIDEQYAKRLRIIKRSQLIEREYHKKAYAQALADRSSLMDSTLPAQSSAITPANTANTTVIGEMDGTLPTPICGNTTSAIQTPKPQSPSTSSSRMLPIQDMVPTPVASRESSQPTLLDRDFSASVQREFTADGREQYIFRFKTKNRKALQEAIKAKRPASDANTMESLQTPISADSTTNSESAPLRTVTFDEVYQGGQAKHKDAIVEFPPASNQWYILKCEEHALRFSNRFPIAGAAKHLNGRLHGHLERNYALAIKMLGYRVVDCNKQLAKQNNDVVDDAFMNGYKPISLINPESKKSRPRKSKEGARSTTQQISDNPNCAREANAISQGVSPLKARKNAPKTSKEIITNPKPFHVYNCFWSPERCLYPVMILGWDDQTPGGLDFNLAGTGLLDKRRSKVPRCYVYKDIDSVTNGAIIGWSQGFEDGGPKVKLRKFPVMFFDNHSNVSWVAAKTLSKFPLYQQDQTKENHYYWAARRYIAKNEGYSSWEDFEAAQKGNTEGTLGFLNRQVLITKMPPIGVKIDAVMTPIVSPLTTVNDSNDDSETDESMQSSISNVTEKELREMQETAGEIDGDDDYFASEADSTLSNYDQWEHPEVDGRPWAFYQLRKSDNAPGTTDAKLPAHGNHASVCDQGGGSSGEDSPTLKPIFQDIYIKGAIEKERNAKTPRSTTPSNLDIVSTASLATSFKEVASLAHTAQTHDITSKQKGPGASAHASTCLTSAPPHPVSSEPIRMGERPKRARSEEMTGVRTSTARPDKAKKVRVETEPPNNQERTSVAQQEMSKPSSAPIVHPTLPCVFEISSYRKGPVSWVSGGPCLELHYQENQKRVATVDACLDIVIDPTTLRGFAKEEIPESKDCLLTLFPNDINDDPVTVVFNRAEGSKKEIGKTQARRFILWLREVVPYLPTLKSNEPNKYIQS
ncbi:hypothetical protein RRF57_001648 [Xylaria bambusicola]|uniref:Uncharacterized protein n=1 Tax=Xylaria bambusicola TaxID=326684 RepID=A0AAN7UE48_9PEZI